MCDTNAVRYKSSIKFFKCIKMNFPFNENTDGLNNEHTRCQLYGGDRMGSISINMKNDLNLLTRNGEKKRKTFYLKARLLTSFWVVEMV